MARSSRGCPPHPIGRCLLRRSSSKKNRSARNSPSAAWKIEAISVAPHDVLELLANLPSEEETTPGVKIGSDLRYWQHAGQLAQELLAQQRFAPVLLEEGVRYLGVWQPQWNNADLARLDRLTQVLPSICRAVGRDERSGILNPRALLTNFLTITVDAFAREHADFGKAIVASKDMPVAEAWLVALRSADPIVPASFPTLVQYHDQYRAWTEAFPGAIGGDTFRLCFRLDPPATDVDPDADFCAQTQPARLVAALSSCRPPTISVCSCRPKRCGASAAAR